MTRVVKLLVQWARISRKRNLKKNEFSLLLTNSLPYLPGCDVDSPLHLHDEGGHCPPLSILPADIITVPKPLQLQIVKTNKMIVYYHHRQTTSQLYCTHPPNTFS